LRAKLGWKRSSAITPDARHAGGRRDKWW